MCWERLQAFMFPRETDTWLAVLRIGLGLQTAVYTLFVRSDWHYLFASSGKGLVGRELGEAITSFDSPLIPKLGWLVALGRSVNMSEETVLSVAWACLLSAGCFLLLGLFCRPAAIVAWFLHLCAAESGGLLAYGADSFMTTALFYLMLSPLPDRYSFDHWVVKTKPKNPQLLGFWRRVLQVHLCFVYFIGGLAKCLGTGWWDGSNLWRSLIRPPFNLVPPDMLVRFKYALPVLGISICLLEVSYPIFICTKNGSAEMFWKRNFCRNSKRAACPLSLQRFTSKIAICPRTVYAWHSIKLPGCMPKQQRRSASRFAKACVKFRRHAKPARSRC